jgi:nicotinamide-nucleotide amidase
VRIETICTGDELLTGLTADTNSPFFQAMLLERCSLQVRRSVVVPDVREDIIEALNAAAARCEVVLVSGGLGPTADDVTAECAAEAAGVELLEDANVLRHIEERFAKRNFKFTPNNKRQARVPAGCEVVLNTEGSAPLFIQTRGSCTLFYVPGVPREYRHLVETQVVPRINALRGELREFSALRVLKTLGLGESHLDAVVRPLFDKHPLVTFGFRTHAPENHLKLMGTAPTLAEAHTAVAAAEKDSREVLGRFVFGAAEDSISSVVLGALRSAKATLAVAESCTGGLVSEQLTANAGSSDVFVGGAIVYSESMKTRWAGVSPELIAAHGAVSEPVARAMASGIRQATGASWGLSVTGYAGPGGGDVNNPVGTVYLCVSSEGAEHVERHHFLGDRDRVRAFASSTLLDLLRRTLIGNLSQ